MRWYVMFLMIAFFGTLAAVVGGRAAAEAQAFAMGVLCGVAASVPASVLAYVLARQQSPVAAMPEPRQERGYPPVVMVSSPPPAHTTLAPTFPMPGAADVTTPMPRYRVVGDE